MDKEQGRKPEGADASTPQRFSAARKVAAVTRLLRGEPLEVVARDAS
jgi:hypothetical protein